MRRSAAVLRPRRSLDWRRAARLLVAGFDSESIARAMGIGEDHFWRHLERSPRFHRFVASATAREIRNCRDEMVNLFRDKQK